MAALAAGVLRIDGDCAWFEAPETSEPPVELDHPTPAGPGPGAARTGPTIVSFHSDFRVEDDHVVFVPTGEVVARDGDSVELGGGLLPQEPPDPCLPGADQVFAAWSLGSHYAQN